jgi:uncharacterized protein
LKEDNVAKITEEMKKFMEEELPLIVTASPDGMPSVAPKGTTRVLDEEHITFVESGGKRTWENLKKNPKVAIVVFNKEKMKCLRFHGKAEIITSGPLFEESAELMKKLGAHPARALIKVKVDEIYDVGSPGFGQKIG